MRKYGLPLIALAAFPLMVILFQACSTEKDSMVNRAYHNTTARYNGYYYARESIKDALTTIKANHKDDYEDILPIFLTPDSAEAIGIYPQMDRAITKSTNVIKKHSMNISNKERCRWIDDNYMVIGKAQFYKRTYADAEKVFDYVVKEYKTLPTKYDGLLWLVRTYTSSGQLDKAGLTLGVANEDKDFPKKIKGELYKVNTVYYIARKNYAVAADNLAKAIPLERKKKNRIRLTYILAQLYQRAGKSGDALRSYQLVAQKSGDYNMVFNARIYQALSIENRGTSAYKVKDDLMKMLRDDKNIEYRDQIYYALAEVSFKERKQPEAVEYLKKSTEASTTNVKQKSKSFLRLAQYYFDQKLYQSADTYYDNSLTVLPTTYPEYEQIKKTAADLEDLVKELNTIRLQDSLLALAKLTPQEREKKLKEVARALQKQAEEDAAKKKAALEAASKSTATAPAPKIATTGSTGDFYFYNTQAKTMGFNDFKKKWGARKLEDNWRRSNKAKADGGVDGFADTGSDSDSAAIAATKDPGSDIKITDLEKNIPLTDALQQDAHNKIIQALYNSGIIYKERFKDTESSIEAFQNLTSRYKDSQYQAVAYYQLYRMFLQKEKNKGAFSSDIESSSFYYKDKILNEYPNSEFARLVENPEYLKEAQANIQNDISDYRRVYNLYKENNFAEALMAVDTLINSKPASPIAAKFYFLKSKIYSSLKDVDSFVNTLNVLVVKYASTEEGKEAKRLLDALKGKLPPKTAPGDSAAAAASAKPPASTAPEAAPDFKEDANGEHYLAIVFPNKGQDAEKMKTNIAEFNTVMFSLKKFQMTNTFIDNDNQILIVKSFPNKAEAMTYYRIFSNDKKTLKNINKEENKVFVITVENFIALFNNKKTNDYLQFFEEKYKK